MLCKHPTHSSLYQFQSEAKRIIIIILLGGIIITGLGELGGGGGGGGGGVLGGGGAGQAMTGPIFWISVIYRYAHTMTFGVDFVQ